MKTLIRKMALALGATLTLTLTALLSPALAAGGGPAWDKFPDKRVTDMAALQNGAKLFVNYCLNCHPASFMRYNRMRDIGLSDEQINEPEEPKLDANSVGGGIVFSPTPLWDITFAGMTASYDSQTDVRNITYEKAVWNLTVGAQYRF